SPMAMGRDSKAESLSPRERAAERERMVLDIKVKLQGLWLRLLKLGATDDPLSSFEYGTILGMLLRVSFVVSYPCCSFVA
ncbi:Denn domain and wd repeat-containing protein scd1, partial [Thalictrum thalictroides]